MGDEDDLYAETVKAGSKMKRGERNKMFADMMVRQNQHVAKSQENTKRWARTTPPVPSPHRRRRPARTISQRTTGTRPSPHRSRSLKAEGSHHALVQGPFSHAAPANLSSAESPLSHLTTVHPPIHPSTHPLFSPPSATSRCRSWRPKATSSSGSRRVGLRHNP